MPTRGERSGGVGPDPSIKRLPILFMTDDEVAFVGAHTERKQIIPAKLILWVARKRFHVVNLQVHRRPACRARRMLAEEGALERLPVGRTRRLAEQAQKIKSTGQHRILPLVQAAGASIAAIRSENWLWTKSCGTKT